MRDLTCKQEEKLILPFIRDTLDNRTKRQFLNHLDHCDQCLEELSIQFLVTIGMQRLENGDAFDLNRELRGRIATERRHLHILDSLQGALFAAQAITLLLSVLIFLIVVVSF